MKRPEGTREGGIAKNATKPGEAKWGKDRRVRRVGPKKARLIPGEVKARSDLAGRMLLWALKAGGWAPRV